MEDVSRSHMMLLYQTYDALPDDPEIYTQTIDGRQEIPLLDFDTATENCHSVSVVTTRVPPQPEQQCLALVGQIDSFEVDRFMRVEIGAPMNGSLPLTRVGRGVAKEGVDHFRVPSEKTIPKGLDFVREYAENIEQNLKQLKPIVEKIANPNRTVVVMVSNYGQSELLINFVCRARARNITSTQHVLVVATDEPTQKLAESLGLVTYLDTQYSKKISLKEAGAYGDTTFRQMMLLKVFAVQWVNALGYNVLFQDLDIAWYQDPIPYFQNYEDRFDMIFQDDGSRGIRFIPYSGNSGAYYVSYNARTRYLMSTLVHKASFVLQTGSHQQSIIAIMHHHASLHGLRVKTLSSDPQLPAGFQYHHYNRTYIRQVIAGNITPTLFHMSWTINKTDKVLFMEQMGLWHVADQCREKEEDEESSSNKNNKNITVNVDGNSSAVTRNVEECCVVEPIIRCHYSDTPAVIDCRDSPQIHPKGTPFSM